MIIINECAVRRPSLFWLDSNTIKLRITKPSWDTDHNFQNPKEKQLRPIINFICAKTSVTKILFIQQNSKNYLQKYNKMRQCEAMNI